MLVHFKLKLCIPKCYVINKKTNDYTSSFLTKLEIGKHLIIRVVLRSNSRIKNAEGKSNKRLDLEHYTIKCQSGIVLLGPASLNRLLL